MLCEKSLLFAIVVFATLVSCGQGSHVVSTDLPPIDPSAKPSDAKYSWIKSNILDQKCMDCHSANQGDGDGLPYANFDSYEGVLKVVNPRHPETSSIYLETESKKMPKGMDPMPGMPMPPPPPPLSGRELQAIYTWIVNGAVND